MVGRAVLVFTLAVTLLSVGPVGATTLFGPTPYLCFDTATAPAGCGGADSPFKSLSFSYFFLETFEDHLFNVPGVTASAGGVTSVVFGPSIHDSVDADDGAIDGSGLLGDSFFSSSGASGITFTFSAAILGALPTHVGIVWTDGAGTISFSASGLGGALAPCTIVGYSDPGSPDGSVSGTTAEDRFFGCSDPGGISSISISNSSGGIEVDHLQYGLLGAGPGPSVPAPASLILLGSGLICMAVARRLRRR
ncbi:MAG TPA: PEP-CTERM sorting domain-containing protein [Methylomirabilota bacterium]|nr:PEP-CTERM sorting domain-containing protein [Methylomirabilota bacterium]